MWPVALVCAQFFVVSASRLVGRDGSDFFRSREAGTCGLAGSPLDHQLVARLGSVGREEAQAEARALLVVVSAFLEVVAATLAVGAVQQEEGGRLGELIRVGAALEDCAARDDDQTNAGLQWKVRQVEFVVHVVLLGL